MPSGAMHDAQILCDYPAPAWAHRYAAVFNASVVFDAEHVAIRMPIEWRALSCPLADAALYQLALGRHTVQTHGVHLDALLESWLELRQAIDAHPDIQQMLFDPVTGLPTTPLLFPRIESLLADRGEVTMLCVNVVRYSRIEEIYGWQVFDDVMREVATALDRIAGRTLRDSDVIAELMISGNSFVIVLSPPRTTACIDPDARIQVAQRVEASIHEELSASLDPALYAKFGCFVGAATVCRDEEVRLERLVYDGLEEALADSHARQDAGTADRVLRLRQILESNDIHTLVHPIVDILDGSIIGYEALSRGPVDSEFERPDKLFKLAYDADLVLRLERLCRRRALEAAADLPAGRLLFLNIEPEAVADPQLRDVVTSSLLADVGMEPSRIVLEITERGAVTDFAAFRSTLDYVRTLGFSVAVDDAGAGFASLQCLAEVQPPWLKVDMSLVRGCNSDEVRASLIAGLVSFANRTSAQLIAEGVETEAELAKLREIGVRYAQGYLFSMPVQPFPTDEEVNVPLS
jgi:EAL domain-containing protein (putative c-di-GMP-specific phosphodiesterase class I)